MVIEKLKTLEMYEEGRYWAFLAIKINEIIDHLNTVEAQNGKQQEEDADNSPDDKSEPDKMRALTVHEIIRQAKADTNKLISVYCPKDKVKFYLTKKTHGEWRTTCVIEVDDMFTGDRRVAFLVGRATCSP